MSSEEEESDTVFDDTTDTNIAKIVVCHLSKAEQKQMRGITGNKPKCEDCKTNFAHKKVEVTLKNDAGKHVKLICNHCYLDMKNVVGADKIETPDTKASKAINFLRNKSNSRPDRRDSNDDKANRAMLGKLLAGGDANSGDAASPSAVASSQGKRRQSLGHIGRIGIGGSSADKSLVTSPTMSPRTPTSGSGRTEKQALKRHQQRARFYHIKGTNVMRVLAVPTRSLSMNTGDVYVLDCMELVYVWNGAKSSKPERVHGLYFAKLLADQQFSKLVVVDEPTTPLAFWEILGGQHVIRNAEDGGDDDNVDFPHILYGCVEERVFELGRGSGLHRELLNTSSVYILDCEERVFIWAGAQSLEAEQVVAYKYGEQLLANRKSATKPHPSYVREGAESPYFRQQLRGYNDAEKLKLAATLEASGKLKFVAPADQIQAPRVLQSGVAASRSGAMLSPRSIVAAIRRTGTNDNTSSNNDNTLKAPASPKPMPVQRFAALHDSGESQSATDSDFQFDGSLEGSDGSSPRDPPRRTASGIRRSGSRLSTLLRPGGKGSSSTEPSPRTSDPSESDSRSFVDVPGVNASVRKAWLRNVSTTSYSDLANMIKKHGLELLLLTDKRKQTALHVAASKNSVTLATWILSKEHSSMQSRVLAAADKSGWTPLHVAANIGHLSMCALLLEHGANAAARTSDFSGGTTPLHYVVRHGWTEPEMPAVIRSMLYSSDLTVDELDANGVTPLLRAVRKGSTNTVRDLIKLGANVHHIDNHGEGALHYACRALRLDMLILLLDAGVDSSLSNVEGKTAMDIAAAEHATDLISVLKRRSSSAPKPLARKISGNHDSAGRRGSDLRDSDDVDISGAAKAVAASNRKLMKQLRDNSDSDDDEGDADEYDDSNQQEDDEDDYAAVKRTRKLRKRRVQTPKRVVNQLSQLEAQVQQLTELCNSLSEKKESQTARISLKSNTEFHPFSQYLVEIPLNAWKSLNESTQRVLKAMSTDNNSNANNNDDSARIVIQPDAVATKFISFAGGAAYIQYDQKKQFVVDTTKFQVSKIVEVRSSKVDDILSSGPRLVSGAVTDVRLSQAISKDI